MARRGGSWRRGLTRWGLGLRERVSLAFGLLALILSALLSMLVWTVVSQDLTAEFRSSALAQAEIGRGSLELAARSQSGSVSTLLAEMPRDNSVASMSLVRGQWYSTSPALGAANLPGPVVTQVQQGDVASERVSTAGRALLAVGLPMSPRGSGFFELFPLAELDRTLRTVAWSLAAGAMVTALLGAAFGRVASGVALRPLTALNQAAGAVAAGRLDVRLRPGRDPDLVPLARSFNRTVGQLAHRVEADSRFAADVSHELRTPLTTMLNSVQLIKNREAVLPDTVREPLDLLAEELGRFRTLVTDLLEMARHDAGEQLVLEPVDVAELVRRAADEAAGRAVTQVVAGAPKMVLNADKRRLERVVANLVGNAEAHGGGVVAVRVAGRRAAVRVEVDDAGPGLPPDMRTRVFDRFARGASTAGGGVGLGLAIVQRHVAAHGGTVWCEQRPGGGSRFIVELPTGPR